MRLNAAGRKLITEQEGLRLNAYLCPSSVWTIGYGHTGDVKKGDKITAHQADVIFDLDVEKFEEGVAKLAPTANENQFSALVSFAFNCGLVALGKSTLLKKFNAGDVQGAAAEFGKWVYGKNGKLPGLIIRRALEKALFLA